MLLIAMQFMGSLGNNGDGNGNGGNAQSPSYIDKLYYGCLDGKVEIGRCLKDPCEPGLHCKDHPTAKCYTNLCQTCTAKWWIGDKLVDCKRIERGPETDNAPGPSKTAKANRYISPRKSFKLSDNRVLTKRLPPPSWIQRVRTTTTLRPRFSLPPRFNTFNDRRKPTNVIPLVNTNERDDVDYQGSKLYFGCSEDSVIDYCVEDPCISQANPCTNYPEAECHANVCESCNVKWWMGNELIEDCFTDAPILAGKERPRLAFSKPIGLNDWQLYHGCNGVGDVVDCPSWEWNKLCPSLDPEEAAYRKRLEDKGAIYDNPGCPNYPSAICHPNACSTCTVKYWFWGNPVDCDEPFGELRARQTFGGFNDTYCPEGYTCQCEQGKDPIFCYYDPCSVNVCYAHPDAECRSNNCDGCNAQFYLRGKRVFC